MAYIDRSSVTVHLSPQAAAGVDHPRRSDLHGLSRPAISAVEQLADRSDPGGLVHRSPQRHRAQIVQHAASMAFNIERRTAIRRNVNPFTLVIRWSSYAGLTTDGTVLEEWRRLQCVNQTLKS
jgi:hypothetical protein